VTSAQRQALVRLLVFSTAAGLVLAGVLLPLVGGAGLFARGATVTFNNLPADLKAPPPPERSRLLAADGSTIAEFFTQDRVNVPLAQVAPLMQKDGGRVRALAVTSKQPHPSFAALPPLAIAVPGYEMDIWIGVFAPAGTPQAVIDRLNREINAISASPELAVLLGPDGTLPQAITPSAFAARVKDELAKWKQLAAAHKIVAE